MGRRKKGEGSYGERTINGIQYKYYKFPDGKFIYAKTSKELREKKEKREKELASEIIDNYYLFGDYCGKWLKQKHKLTPKAYDDYETAIRKRVLPYSINNRPVKSLTPQMVTMYLDELAANYSKGSIDKTWVIIRQVLNWGMERGDIPQFPLSRIERPKERDVKNKKKDLTFIDLEDMESIYIECQKNRYGNGGALIVFIMYSGLRLSEAINLKWVDVSRDKSSITVRRASQRSKVRDKDGNVVKVDGKIQYETTEKDPKSEAGKRLVPLPDRATEILNKMQNDTEYVFITKNKTPYSPRTIERLLKTILANSDSFCKDYTPHALRRGYGSVLLSQGTNMAVISKLLGHEKVSTTADIYTKAYDKDIYEAVARLNSKKGEDQ